MRPLQTARNPNRIARQDFPDCSEYLVIAGVAADVLLSIDAAIILTNRRVAHPPPSCRDHARRNRMLQHEWLGGTGHRGNPQYCSMSLYVSARDRSSHFIPEVFEFIRTHV